jgi:hypothetical protein
MASVPLSAQTATYTISSLSGIVHTIKATYSGKGDFASSSGDLVQVVSKYPTTTTVTTGPNPSIFGQEVVLTAKVTSDSVIPAGKVTFLDATIPIGSSTLSGDVATLATSKLSAGEHVITAQYMGSATHAKSNSSATIQIVTQATLAMKLTSSPNPSSFDHFVRFTATMTSDGRLPVGSAVTFSLGTATLGTAKVDSIGLAIFSTTALPRGSDIVKATFPGNMNYSAAKAWHTQTVN